MTFPVWIPIGPWRLHPHLVFETLAYIIGFALYVVRRRRLGDHVPDSVRWSLVTAAAIGAVVGSRLLFWVEDGVGLQSLGGKTMVGGVLGGWLAVELEKKRLGVREPTGDLFAFPIAIGMAIGRIGCFLSGLPDGTYGVETSLPWGVDLGDGVRRHPTALYESLFMVMVALVLWRAEGKTRRGGLFSLFVMAYLGFRLLVDFIKPGTPIALGLTGIQWACVVGLAFQLWQRVQRSRARSSGV